MDTNNIALLLKGPWEWTWACMNLSHRTGCDLTHFLWLFCCTIKFAEEDFDQIGPSLPEKEIDKKLEKEPELLVRDDLWRQNAPMREWDEGKKGEGETHGPVIVGAAWRMCRTANIGLSWLLLTTPAALHLGSRCNCSGANWHGICFSSTIVIM